MKMKMEMGVETWDFGRSTHINQKIQRGPCPRSYT